MTEATPFVVLPAIDLRGGRVVRLRQGDFARETAYSDDPPAVALRFAAAGAQWLHVVDLDAARTGIGVNGAAIAAIVAAVGGGMRVEVAGGLRDVDAVAAALSSGAARAVIGTAALRDPAFAGQLISLHGADRIAIAIDIRDGRAIGRGWAHDAETIDVEEAMDRLTEVGVVTFEVTAIERDGLLDGPNLGLYRRLTTITGRSIIASGGIASATDLRAVRAIGCTGAIVGRAIYEGRIDLEDALRVAQSPA